MAKHKFYAVAVGRVPGVYTAWFGPNGAEVQIRGYEGARFKGFATQAEAQAWMQDPGPMPRWRTARTAPAPKAPADPLAFDCVIYADGGSTGNPGPGGYGVVLLRGDERREFAGGFRKTTNNRMELMGVITGLSQVEDGLRVLVRTDSQYVVNGINKGWAKRWRRNKWMRTPADPAENYDLWQALLELTERHKVVFEWVKGHAGQAENERCDELARAAGTQRGLPADENYEQRRTTVQGALFGRG